MTNHYYEHEGYDHDEQPKQYVEESMSKDNQSQDKPFKDDEGIRIDAKGATVTLEYPTEVGGTKLTEVRMRRAKYRDQKAVSDMEGKDAIDVLFVNLSELSKDTILELDPIDIKRMDQVVMYFLGVTQAS